MILYQAFSTMCVVNHITISAVSLFFNLNHNSSIENRKLVSTPRRTKQIELLFHCFDFVAV